MGLPILCCKGQRSKSAALPFAAENDRLVFEKMLSLRDQCAHSSALRAAFGGCALDAPAGAVVWQSPYLEGKCTKYGQSP